MRALPAVLVIRERDAVLRLVAALILVGAVGPAIEELAGREVGAPRDELVFGEQPELRGRAQGEVVEPLCDQHVEEHAIADDARPLGLVGIVVRGLVAGRRQRRRQAEVAQGLQLRPLVPVANQLVVARELVGALDRVVRELRLREQVGARDVGVLVVEAIRVEEPRLALVDRAADVAVQVVLLVNLVAAAHATRRRLEPVEHAARRLEFVGHVVGNRRVALPVAVPRSRQPVAARLDGDVHRAARRVLVGAAAGPAELELLERAEIEVPRVGVGALGGVDTLEARRALLADAVGDEAGLRAGVRAAHVVAVHLESRGLRHRGPDITRIGDLGQEFLGEVGADGRRRGVNDGRLARHRHGLFEGGDVELPIDRQRLADDDADAVALEGTEAGEFERQLVESCGQGDQAIRTVVAGHGDLGLDQGRAGGRDRDARQDGAAAIGDRAVDAAAEVLRAGGRGQGKRTKHGPEHAVNGGPHRQSSSTTHRTNMRIQLARS